jgi:hypothetical protein
MRTQSHPTVGPPAAFLIAAVACVAPAGAGVLLDYGADPAAFNDAGVVRAADNPNNQFGFTQFQLVNIDAPAWRIDRVTVNLRLWNAIATGEATLAIYGADGLEPDLLDKVSEDFAFTVDSLFGEAVRLDLGGLELERGVYFVGIAAAEPTAELLWLAGEDSAFRTARRSDGGFFSGSPRALSLAVEGAIVPVPAAGVPLLLVLAARRRRA